MDNDVNKFVLAVFAALPDLLVKGKLAGLNLDDIRLAAEQGRITVNPPLSGDVQYHPNDRFIVVREINVIQDDDGKTYDLLFYGPDGWVRNFAEAVFHRDRSVAEDVAECVSGKVNTVWESRELPCLKK